MDDLQQQILNLIKKTIPDLNDNKAKDLVLHITSEDVGVRALERLYDLPQDVIALKVPLCDAVKLHRSWQAKFRPDQQVLRQLQSEPAVTYRVKWEKVPRTIMNQLEEGQWLAKQDRCLLIRLVVSDVLAENPKFSRRMFSEVARSMVAKYPHALHDRNKKLSDCQYFEQKLKFRFDEEMRAFQVKKNNDAPNIPEAHGCVRWRLKITEAERQIMTTKKEDMITTFQGTIATNWVWEEIEKTLIETYPLQREDINSQVTKKRKRARGAGQQDDQQNIKTTKALIKEWPFLFQFQGMVLHFNELTQRNWQEKLSQFKENYEPKQFIKFMSTLRELNESSTRKKFKRALKKGTCRDPDLLAIVLMLLDYYKEEKEEIIIEIESTTRLSEVADLEDLQLPPIPCLLSLGPVFKATKFFFSIDSGVVCTVRSFKDGLSLLFCSYFVLNIKYAPNAGNTLDFLQRVVAQIEPDHGTKVARKNYKLPLSERLQTLLDKYATWQRRQQHQPEENIDDPDNSQ